jgi:hypothetical protein
MSLKEKVEETKKKIKIKHEEIKGKLEDKKEEILGLKERMNNLSDFKKLTQEELDFCFKAQKFNEIKDKIQSCDILLYRGPEGKEIKAEQLDFHDKIIEKATLCYFSHINLFIVNPTNEIKAKYNIENSSESIFLFGTEEHSKTEKVHLTPFSVWLDGLKKYKKFEESVMVWRRLENFEISLKSKELEEFLLSNHEREFKHDVKNIDRFFCAEIVAEALQTVGVLKSEEKNSKFATRDFTSIARIDQADIELENDFFFNKEIRIKF